MPNDSAGVPRIFVSHSHHDGEFCRSFVGNLRTSLNLADPDHVFYDETSLHFGDQWLQRIQNEVLARPIFMVILTPRSVAASYVRQETNLALRETIARPDRKLIPILAEECDPNELAPLVANFQTADFIHYPYQGVFDSLVAFLRTWSQDQDNVAPLSVTGSAHFHVSSEALRARSLAREVHLAVEAGRWSDAVVKGEFAQSLPENRANATLFADLALAYAELRNWERVGESARLALDLDLFRSDVWLLRAKSLHDAERIPEAIDAIDRARAVTFLADRAGHLSLLALRRSWLMELSRWSEALDTIGQELVLAPDDPMRVTTRSELLKRLGRPETSFAAGSISSLPPVLDAAQWPTLGSALVSEALTCRDVSETGAESRRASRFEQAIQQLRRALSGEK